MIFEIKVKSCAKEDKIVTKNNQFQAYLCAEAKKGKANKALIKLLANYFKVKKQSISIVSGLKSKHKLIKINDYLSEPKALNSTKYHQSFPDKNQKYLSKFHSWER